MTVLQFEPRDSNPNVLTQAQIHTILVKAALYDGRGGHEGPGGADILSWHEAAVMQRWTSLPLALEAVVDYYSRPAKPGERLWIMPGHVTEYIRAHNRQPQSFAEQRLALEGAPPAADERRAAAMRQITAMLGRRKSISEPSAAELAEEANAARAAAERAVAEEARRAAEEARRAQWAEVDACSRCNEAGMRVDAPDVVCDHRAAVATGKSGLEEAAAPVMDHEVAV